MKVPMSSLCARADRRSAAGGARLWAERACRLASLSTSLAASLALSGCAALHTSESALNPAGPQAQRTAGLMWLFLSVCAVVYVLVMLFLFGALLRRPASTPDPLTHPNPQRERRIWIVIFVATGLTVLTLFGLLLADYTTGRANHKYAEQPHPLVIKVTGHQWWWEVTYKDWPEAFGERVPSNRVTTANEIHIPIDDGGMAMPVRFELQSNDVIHSFWVPNLSGKKDLVPGHPTTLWLGADRPGTYWGECAEYCGYQHAQMRLVVVAEPREQFAKWLTAQRQPAPEPATAMQQIGRQVFLSTSCILCHNIQGTPAMSRTGPDLTHVASRKVLAGGAIPNTPGHLAGWIIDPQRIKPGTLMPQNSLSPQDLRCLLEYLKSLR